MATIEGSWANATVHLETETLHVTVKMRRITQHPNQNVTEPFNNKYHVSFDRIQKAKYAFNSNTDVGLYEGGLPMCGRFQNVPKCYGITSAPVIQRSVSLFIHLHLNGFG